MIKQTERQRDIGGGAKPFPETEQARREILIYVRDHGPCKSCDIQECFQYDAAKVKNVLYWLRCMGTIQFSTGMWEFVRMTPDVKAKAQSVSIVRNEPWHMPQPIKVERKDGVKYTYQAAPTNRWNVNVLPGQGVISGDNPGLARLAQ